MGAFYVKNGFWTKKVNMPQQENKQNQHKNPCQSRYSNLGRLVPQYSALPLGQNINYIDYSQAI